MPNHNHIVYIYNNNSSNHGNAAQATGTGYIEAASGAYLLKGTAVWKEGSFNSSGPLVNDETNSLGDHTGTTSLNGGGEEHNNMPPYYVTNIWRRTA